MPDKKTSADKTSAEKPAEAHTEVRPHGTAGAGSDLSYKAPALKPRTPGDRLPGDEDGTDELFNDVPV